METSKPKLLPVADQNSSSNSNLQSIMAKKTQSRKKPVDPNVIPIEIDEPTVAFSLKEEKIEATVVEFHQMAMEAQSEAFMNRSEDMNFMPEYAKKLQDRFNTKIKITEAIAYRIWDRVYLLFNTIKKN